MATPNYDIDYSDKRFTQVENDKQTALSDLEQTYANMINKSDKYYQDQIDASKQWADKQTQLQQDKTDFAIEQIEQQKYQAQKDYTREQSGAYVDWQKQSDPYGANAEKMAASGLQNSGYSESSLVSMYNTYQNRVATARESYNNAVLNYNNSIKEAQLQNNSILAEIAYEALQKQLELSLQGFQYKNQLILEKANKKTELENTYYARYQDVLAQINQENALAEQVRQFNETMAYNKSKSSGSSSGSSGGSGGSVKGSSSGGSGGSVKGSSSGGSGGSVKGGSSESGNPSISLRPDKSYLNAEQKDPPIDMDSVIALGYGSISEARLVELENSGIIKSRVVNGKRVFTKTARAINYFK